MFYNYLKVALRNLRRNKIFSAINISGLTVGLTCCLLMVLYIQHELSYDKFQDKGDRIARVIMQYKFSDGEMKQGVFTSTKVLPAFQQQFSEVESGVRMSRSGRLVKLGTNLFDEKEFFFADSTFFNIFSFKLIRGTASEVLKAPNMVVLTKSTAKKYFGDEDPVGKTLQVSSRQDEYIVTGIAEDCPSNSQIKFDFVASFSSLGPAQQETYFNANYTTYLLLKDRKSIASLQSKIEPFMKKEMATRPDTYINYNLEPYTSVHLYSSHDGFEASSNITYIYIIAGIALLILIIACFTYINLSTARSIERAREVGIRKVSGAFRFQIFSQFISESMVVTGVAMILSFAVAGLLLPAFNQLAQKELEFVSMFTPSVLLVALLIAVVIALFAGSYPALILSKFQPIKVLKGSFRNTSSGAWLRKSLIVFQFVVSVFLVVATMVIQQQLHFIQHKKLGYDREHVINVTIDQKIMEKMDLLKSELTSNPSVLAVSKAYNTPVQIEGNYSMSIGDPETTPQVSVKANPVDEDFVKANNLQLIAGRDLAKQDMLDVSKKESKDNYFHFILNESAVAALGWQPADAIGKKLNVGYRAGEVKGVVKDFHFASLHTPVEPLILFPDTWGSVLMIKTTGADITSTLAFIERKWKTIAPHRPFSYRFMDDDYAKLYDSELRTGKIFNIFSVIAIVLACLGLFGLSAYSARQRLKEIGVRKVLGASVSNITLLLASNFLKLVGVAFLVACPVAWWAMHHWLQDFAYRINIQWWVFATAGVLALLIAMITVSFQAIRAATSNPVKSLRSE